MAGDQSGPQRHLPSKRSSLKKKKSPKSPSDSINKYSELNFDTNRKYSSELRCHFVENGEKVKGLADRWRCKHRPHVPSSKLATD